MLITSTAFYFACSFANMSEDAAKVDALIRELDQELPPEDER
jgi:hypothetical protein